jgi:hypothetical protein
MIVEWIPQSQYASDYIDPPKPAKNYVPDWYKNLPPFAGGHTPKIYSDRADSTEKHCMPLFDTFTTGYIQESWCDISVRVGDDGNVSIDAASHNEPMIVVRNVPNRMIPRNQGYYLNKNNHMNWWTHWEPRTPKGWSTYYSHPFNQYDAPFRTMDGIIDTDKWWIGGSVPFMIKEGFEGIIPKGTPLYQMFFFKRENWKSKIMKHEDIELEKNKLYKKIFDHFYGGYKRHSWSKKVYE